MVGGFGSKSVGFDKEERLLLEKKHVAVHSDVKEHILCVGVDKL